MKYEVVLFRQEKAVMEVEAENATAARVQAEKIITEADSLDDLDLEWDTDSGIAVGRTFPLD